LLPPKKKEIFIQGRKEMRTSLSARCRGYIFVRPAAACKITGKGKMFYDNEAARRSNLALEN